VEGDKMSIDEKIQDVLDKIRPFIQNDGGDVEYIGFEDGIVKIKMLGNCADCMLLDTTVNDGIEMILMDEVEGVIGVEVVDN
jgi:Fe-S cluster biogenesis protein NfuA